MKIPGFGKPAPKNTTHSAGGSTSAGAAAEQYGCTFLTGQGLTIAATNYRCRGGEIDIVAKDQQTLVFVEVRLRSNRLFGDGASSIDRRKQQRLILTAEHYLLTHTKKTPPCRFDVLSLSPALDKDPPYQVEWIVDAFRP